MSAIECSSALLQLPRELRDKIYTHCLSRSYVVFWYFYDRDLENHDLADLSILRTSKVINTDAKQSMFSRAASQATTFVFDFGFDSAMTFTTPPSKDDTNSMMNVKFIVRLDSAGMQARAEDYYYHESEAHCPPFSMKSICEATVDRFAGKMVIRDSIHIQFLLVTGDIRVELDKVMRTPFFQALKSFNGFRTLVVELNWLFFSNPNGSADTQKEVRALQTELGPSLGHSVNRSLTEPLDVDASGRTYVDLAIQLKFKPLKFHVEKLRAEAATLTEEADMLEG